MCCLPFLTMVCLVFASQIKCEKHQHDIETKERHTQSSSVKRKRQRTNGPESVVKTPALAVTAC